MDKFWRWMAEKRRLSTHDLSCVSDEDMVIHKNGVIYYGSKCDHNSLQKQMLIGYMFEYLYDKINVIADFSAYNIDELYDCLEFEIKEIK